MPQWYDITRKPEYQSLSPEDQSTAKQEFFQRFILPKIDADEELKGDEDVRKAAYYKFMQSPDDTGQGYITSMAGSAARGFSEVVPGAIQGLGALTGISPLETAGESIRSGIESVAPVNPLYAESIPVKAAGVAGQIGSVLGTAGVGGLAGKALGAERIAAGATAAEQALATTKAVTQGANAALYGSAGLQGAASGAQLADQYGLQGGARYANILAGAAGEIGSEMLPFGLGAETAAAKRLLGAAPQTGRALGAIASEAGEEGINQLWQNAALKTLAPEGVNTPSLTEGVLESAAYGGLGGGILAGVNVATGAYKQPEIAAAADLVHSAATTSDETPLTTAAAEQSVQAAATATSENDLTRYMPPADLQSGLTEAPQPDLNADAFAGLQPQIQNEPAITAPVGGVIPAVGQEEAAAIQSEQQMPDGLGVFETPQLAANEPASPESLASESEGVLRNRAQIANAAALNKGQIAPTPIPSVFPQVQPTAAEQPVERRYTVANVKTGKIVSRPDEPMTHKEAVTFRSKFSQPNNFTLVDVTNEQPISPQAPSPKNKPTQTASGKKVGDKIDPGEDVKVLSEDDQSTPGMPEELTVLEVEGILDAGSNKVFARRRDMTPAEIAAKQDKIRQRNTVAAEMGFPQEAVPQPISPQGVVPTGIATTTGQPMSGDSGIARDATKPEQMTPEEALTRPKKANDVTINVQKTRDAAQESLNSWVDTRKDRDAFKKITDKYNVPLSDMYEVAQISKGKWGAGITHQHMILLATGDKKPVSASAVDAYKIKLPESYQRQGELYVYSPNSPAAQKEPPLTPSGQVANEGGGPVTSNETEAGFQVQPPVATKETPDAEVSSGKVAYSYEMRARPPGIGTHPKEGLVSHTEGGKRHGFITYNRPLTEKEIYDYELKPVSTDSVEGPAIEGSRTPVSGGGAKSISSTTDKRGERLASTSESDNRANGAVAEKPKKGDLVTVSLGGREYPKTRILNVTNTPEGVRYQVDVFGPKFVAESSIVAIEKPVIKTAPKVAATPQLIRQLGDVAVKNQQPVDQGYIDAIGGSIPQGYVKQGDSYVFQPETQSPSDQVAAESIELQALEILLQKRPNLSATVAEKAKKYFATDDFDIIRKLPLNLRTDIDHSIQDADPNRLHAQLKSDEATRERDKAMELADKQVEEEMAKRQAKLTESRRGAYDSIVGTPTGVEMNAVSEADGQEALSAVNNTGDVPGVLNAFVGTSGQFLANPENEKNFPDLWKILSAGRVDEGNFAYGRAFVFTDGIGVNASDRRNAERLGITPSVAAVRRVLIHEGLVHRGIYGLPAHLQMQILQWVRQNTTPEQLDNLARDYPQYENWRNNPNQMLGLCEEYLAKEVEKITKFPKDGPLSKLFDILRDIWRWVTGETGEPTVQNLRDIVKLLKAGVVAADARLVNGGKVDIKMSQLRAQGFVTPEQDAEYMAAVESGDVAKQQAMVDAAAKAAGGRESWHGGDLEGHTIDTDRRERGADSERRSGTFYGSSNKEVAKTYPGKLNRMFFFLRNPFEISTPSLRPASWDGSTAVRTSKGLESRKSSLSIGESIDRAKAAGNDGVVYGNVVDLGRNHNYLPHVGETLVAFAPNQIKAADPISRDAEGNVIPLSQRFNAASNDIRFSRVSKPSFANPINAELARAAERFRQMQERQAMETPEGLKELFNPNAQGSGTTNKLFEQQVTPQQIRSEIRAAYDRSIANSGSVQASIQQVFDEAKTQIPTLTEKQFGEQLQALYEDGSAFLVPADRSATMMAAGEKWGVYDASGMPASYVGALPSEVKASVARRPNINVPNEIKEQARILGKEGDMALNRHRALKALQEAQPKFHIKQDDEAIVAVAINIVDALKSAGVTPQELNGLLTDPEFLDDLGIPIDSSLYQAVAMEMYRSQQDEVSRLEKEGKAAAANKLRQYVSAMQKQWYESGTRGGQRLNVRLQLINNPRYQGLFLATHLNESMRETAQAKVEAQTDIKAEDVEKANETAATESADDVAAEIEELEMAELDRLGEEQLDDAEKPLWQQIKGYITKLGAIAYARLQKASGNIKASNAAESASDMVRRYISMPDKEIDAEEADIHQKLKAAMKKFMGKGTETQKKVKKDLVDRTTEVAKKPRAKRAPKVETAEQKAKLEKAKKDKANATAARIIYRTEELFRQGFKNDIRSGQDKPSIYKEFIQQIQEPTDLDNFAARLAKLKVSREVAERMFRTAALEKTDREAVRNERNRIRLQELREKQAMQLVYLTEQNLRQSGIKGIQDRTASENDSVRKAFKDQINAGKEDAALAKPLTEEEFVKRLAALKVRPEVAKIMFKTADRERADIEASDKFDLLESPRALRNMMRKLAELRMADKTPFLKPISWKKLFSLSKGTQEQRRSEMEAAIRADESLQNLSEEDQKKLADLIEAAWNSQREKVFKTEIDRLTRLKKTSEKAKKAITDSTEKLLEMVNQGVLDNDELYALLAEKFGFKPLTQEQKAEIEDIAQKLQEDLPPYRRTQLVSKFKDIITKTADVPFAQKAADWWVTAVLTGPRTAFTIGLGFLSGGYQVLSNAIVTVARHSGDINAWKAAGASINDWVASMPRNARNALGYLWDGREDRLDPTMSNISSWLNLDKKSLTQTDTASVLLNSKNPISRLAGGFMTFFKRLLVALDMFNAASAKDGSLAMSYYQTRQSQDAPFSLKELSSLRDFKAARDYVLGTEFGGVEPTNPVQKSLLDAWASQYMWQQIAKFEGIVENATYNAQQGAMSLDPSGLGGHLYHAILKTQANQKELSESFMQSSKKALLRADGITEKSVAYNRMLLAYIWHFAAYNMLGAVGLKFARYAGNRLNQTISFVPGLGAFRLHETEGVPHEMHRSQIIANQAMGSLVTIIALALMKEMADEPDEEKRGWGWEGSWDTLTPERKSQRMSAGKQAYTLTIGGKTFKYNNWPMGGVMAAVGSLMDMIQYSPDKWNERTIPGKVASAGLAALLSVGDSASLSQFSEMFGRSVQTRDPLDAVGNTLSKTAANYAGGFIPRIFKDVDKMFVNPEINRYKTPFEFMAREVPIYRSSVGKPMLDIFAKPVAPAAGPTSREFITQPTEPEYRQIGRLNERGIWLTSANPENRLVGKGSKKRHMTDEEGLRYIKATGNAYREFVLRNTDKILSMTPERGKQYVLDKADEIRDLAAKRSVRTSLTSSQK